MADSRRNGVIGQTRDAETAVGGAVGPERQGSAGRSGRGYGGRRAQPAQRLRLRPLGDGRAQPRRRRDHLQRRAERVAAPSATESGWHDIVRGHPPEDRHRRSTTGRSCVRARGGSWSTSAGSSATTARWSGCSPAGRRCRRAPGRPAHLIMHIEDIDDRKTLEAELVYRAQHDRCPSWPTATSNNLLPPASLSDATRCRQSRPRTAFPDQGSTVGESRRHSSPADNRAVDQGG